MTATPTEPETPTEAVFVVGVSRSGTTLMRSILEGSSRIAVCNENHFLGHLVGSEGVRQQLRRRFGTGRDDETARRIIDFLYGDLLKGSRLRRASRQWTWTTRHVPRDEMLRRFLATDRSDRALFDLLLRTYAELRGKEIVGEKTPAHVRYVDTLLSWYPAGKIIHMVRDPRGIYVSEVRRRGQTATSLPYRLLRRLGLLLAPFVAVQTSLAWLESISLLERNSRRHRGSYLRVKFEDLVGQPVEEVKRICDFLGVPFEQPMVDQVVVVSHGRNLGAAGFDPHAASRWRDDIGPIGRAWFGAWFGKRLRRLGYER
jgi:hypothetical protein